MSDFQTTCTLTGLATPRQFEEWFDSALRQPRSSSRVFVVRVNPVGFRMVNHAMGHLAGDAILAAMARTLKEALPPAARIARTSGKKFTFLLHGVTPADVRAITTSALELITQRCSSWEGTPVRLQVRAGIAEIGRDLDTPSAVMDAVELACRQATILGVPVHDYGDTTLFERFDLNRFIEAQDRSYARALDEIRAGDKQSHWMWYIFPQLAGLGMSPRARQYSISGLEEARAYLAHPVLGPRLAECCNALYQLDRVRTAEQIFGSLDAMKLRSSLTLFAAAQPASVLFDTLLTRYFGGSRDERTLELLGISGIAGPEPRIPN